MGVRRGVEIEVLGICYICGSAFKVYGDEVNFQ